MATTYKPITKNDVTTAKTLLHEAIPITGTIVTGTYRDNNIKNFSHGMFQSVYDYPYLSSSANHIFDITVGYSSKSSFSSSANTQNSKKINIYNQMAQVLMGFDHTGSVLEFDRDLDTSAGGTKMRECVFLNFSRLLTKDEVKKQSFNMTLITGSATTSPTASTDIRDYGANTSFKTNVAAGEVGVLYSGSGADSNAFAGTGVGLVFYQAGVVVLTSSIFKHSPHIHFGRPDATYDTRSFEAVLTASNISASADGFRNRFSDMSFNNTVELNSSIYFCRVNHNEFNYSSNPSYLSASQIRVKTKKEDSPVSYITTVGLYSTDNVLVAVAKLSEPLKKDTSNEMTLRVRLDY